MAKKQTAGRDNLGDLAPQFAQLNDDVLFGEVWSREEQPPPRPQHDYHRGAGGKKLCPTDFLTEFCEFHHTSLTNSR